MTAAPQNSTNGPIGRGYFQVLSADFVGLNQTAAQKCFNATTNGAFNPVAAQTYFMEGLIIFTRAAGTTSHTTSFLFGGTASITSIMYDLKVTNPTGNALGAVQEIHAMAASGAIITAANIVATENIRVEIKGVVRINAAGTFIPQISYSAAPGGAPTFINNSYFRLTPIGTNTVTNIGNWT